VKTLLQNKSERKQDNGETEQQLNTYLFHHKRRKTQYQQIIKLTKAQKQTPKLQETTSPQLETRACMTLQQSKQIKQKYKNK